MRIFTSRDCVYLHHVMRIFTSRDCVYLHHVMCVFTSRDCVYLHHVMCIFTSRDVCIHLMEAFTCSLSLENADVTNTPRGSLTK